jgi:hypothetical protein
VSGKAALALTVHGLAQGEDETAGEARRAAQSELEHVQTGSHSVVDAWPPQATLARRRSAGVRAGGQVTAGTLAVYFRHPAAAHGDRDGAVWPDTGTVTGLPKAPQRPARTADAPSRWSGALSRLTGGLASAAHAHGRLPPSLGPLKSQA